MNKTPEISKDLKTALDVLLTEILVLQRRILVNKELFGTNKEIVELLNKTSGNFFYLVQTGLIENIILGISRLSDPAQTLGKRNLSFSGIIDLIEDVNLKKELELQLEWYLKKTTEIFKNWRSKKIAHIDYDVALANAILSNPNTIQNLDIAITSIRQFYNTIYQHYYGSKMVFGFPGNSSTKGILVSLEQGKLLREYLHNLRINNIKIPTELEHDYSKYDQNNELLM